MFWESFWPNFFSNFAADLMVGILLALVIYKIYEKITSPKLRLVIWQNNELSEEVNATKVNEEYELNIFVAIKNDGKETLGKEEGYWHIYLPGPVLEVIDTNNCEFNKPNHFRALIKGPIFPSSFLSTHSNFTVRFKNSDNKRYFLYWFLSTKYGNFPKSVKKDQKTGHCSFELMGKIPIKFADN